MCGIIGIVLRYQRALSKPLGSVIKGCLKNLEYRGYDSVGFALASSNSLVIRKSKGKIDEVDVKLAFDDFDGMCGVGHTRWATHGKPSDINAHPLTDCSKRIVVVHNGIIENYLELKEELIRRGHRFESETDTEVVPHLIEEFKKLGMNSYDAFKKAASLLRGTYALAVIDTDEPGRIYFARNTSPLVIGIRDDATFLASDIPAFIDYTRKVIVIQDDEVGYISGSDVRIEKLVSKSYEVDLTPPICELVDYSSRIRHIDWTPEMAKKGGYPHFMLKEIHEQPQAIASTLSSLANEVKDVLKLISKADRVLIVGAGTSYHASFVGSILLSELAEVKSHAIISSEMKWYSRSVDECDVVIAVSQSGETIDTLLAVREARRRGALTIALTNVIDSTLARESHLTIYTRAGPEVGVAATKTFSAQVVALTYLALSLAEYRSTLSTNKLNELKNSLRSLPDYVSSTISATEPRARSLASLISSKQNAYYLGRGLGLPVSMEGALKLKEVAYIHAESYPAGESKHGPIALVDEGFPVFFTILGSNDGELIVSNVEEMKARGALTIAVIPSNLDRIHKYFNYAFIMHPVPYEVAPSLYIIPHQLLAYYTAVTLGYDPDKPRNLAKTVTVV